MSITKTYAIIIAVVVVIASIGIAYYVHLQTEQPVKELKLGVLLPFTGPYGTQATEQRDALLLAIEEINAAGGILGKKVNVILYDDQTKVDLGLTLLTRLVEVDKVDVLAGALLTASAKAYNNKAREYNMLYWALCLNELDSFRKGVLAKGTWGFVSDGWEHGYIIAYFIKHYLPDIRNVFMMIPAYSFGYDCRDGFLAGVKDWGLDVNIVGALEAPVGTSDFTPYITKIREAKPDLLYLAQAGHDHTNFLKQAMVMGIQKEMKIIQPWSWLMELAPLHIDALENNYFVFWYYWNAPEPGVREFAEKFKSKYGRYPDNFAGFVYEEIKEMARAINLAGSLDPAKVEEALLKSPDFMTMKGPAKWRIDHRPIMENYLYIGKWKTLEKRINTWDIAEVIASFGGEKFGAPLEMLGY